MQNKQMRFNRWHVYQHCKDEYMFSGEFPSREAIKLIFKGTDPEEIDEGIAEFESTVQHMIPVQLDGPKFGDRLAELRHKRGLSQYQLADRTGIKRATLSHYEKNRREPDFETLIKLADFFHVTTDYIVRGA